MLFPFLFLLCAFCSPYFSLAGRCYSTSSRCVCSIFFFLCFTMSVLLAVCFMSACSCQCDVPLVLQLFFVFINCFSFSFCGLHVFSKLCSKYCWLTVSILLFMFFFVFVFFVYVFSSSSSSFFLGVGEGGGANPLVLVLELETTRKPSILFGLGQPC